MGINFTEVQQEVIADFKNFSKNKKTLYEVDIA